MALSRPVAAAVLGLFLAAGASACGDPTAAEPSGVEVEDCDAEDFANREDDCGFTEADRKKKTPAPRKTPTKRR